MLGTRAAMQINCWKSQGRSKRGTIILFDKIDIRVDVSVYEWIRVGIPGNPRDSP